MIVILFLHFIQFEDLPQIKPVVVAIWHGKNKPMDMNEYLAPFVSELKNLVENGLQIKGKKVGVAIRSFICDSPARASVKGA